MTTRTACAALVFLVSFSATAADGAKWGSVGEVPLKQAQTPAPSGPKAEVDLAALDPALRANFGSVPASIEIGGSKLMLGGYVVLESGGRIWATVYGNDRRSAPAGTYRFRFVAANVGWAMPVTVKSGSQTTTCNLQARPGYNNLQVCDLVVATSGQPISAEAAFSGTAPQLTIKTIQVFKEK